MSGKPFFDGGKPFSDDEPVMTNKILSTEYLEARGAAYDAKMFLDPIVADFIDDDDVLDARCWAAFMAGSDWERKYRGARYVEATTSCNSHLDVGA